LPEAVSESLNAYVSGRSLNRSIVVAQALDEGTRIQTHPGIRFVTLATGDRVAALERGPEVWTVAEAWVMADPATRTTEEMTYVTGLTSAEVEAALLYYADFQEEIDAQIAKVWQAQKDAQAAWELLRGASAK